MPRLFVDLDGVLADFDQRAGELLGTDNIYKYEFVYGAEAFWKGVNADPYFFLNMQPMHDALVLWGSIKHLNPVILTALPKTNAENVEAQKRAWVRRHLTDPCSWGPHVIACRTKDKPNYCAPGDVLIDDRAINQAAWEAKGGRYIVHKNAHLTLLQLQDQGIL